MTPEKQRHFQHKGTPGESLHRLHFTGVDSPGNFNENREKDSRKNRGGITHLLLVQSILYSLEPTTFSGWKRENGTHSNQKIT